MLYIYIYILVYILDTIVSSSKSGEVERPSDGVVYRPTARLRTMARPTDWTPPN